MSLSIAAPSSARGRQTVSETKKLSHRTNAFSGRKTNAAPSYRFLKGELGDHCCGTCVVWYCSTAPLPTGIQLPRHRQHHQHHQYHQHHPPVAQLQRHRSFVPVVVDRAAVVGERRVYKYFWSSLQTSVQLTISCS